LGPRPITIPTSSVALPPPLALNPNPFPRLPQLSSALLTHNRKGEEGSLENPHEGSI